MMKKTLALILALAMVLALAACAGNQTTGGTPGTSAPPSQTTGPAPGTDATTAPQELAYNGPELELTVNFNSSEEQSPIYIALFNRISERTGGKVKFIYHYSGSLLSANDALDGLGAGFCDFSDVTLTNFPDNFPYTQRVISYPFLGFRSFNMAAQIINDVVLKNDIMMGEFAAANIQPLFLLGTWGTSMVMADDVVINTPESIAGMKMVTFDPILSRFLNDIGATPVAQPPTEYFSCLSNNVADGIIHGLYVVGIFGAIAPAKTVYMFERSFTTGVRAISANKDTWDSFDDTLKTIIMEEMQGEELWNDGVAYWAASDQRWLDQVTDNNIPLRYIKGEEMQAWADALAPYGDAAMKELYDKGYTEVYNILEVWNNAIENYDGPY